MSIHMDTDGAPFPSVEDDLRRQIMGLRASLASAKAEVDSLRPLLEPKRPYEPKVGDVCLHSCADNPVLVILGGERPRLRPLGVKHSPKSGWTSFAYMLTYLRPATPAERAAAGLPAEAPAKPEVLPEHLALLEADAAWNLTSHSPGAFDHEKNIEAKSRALSASRALLAAIARRDGGAK